MMWLVLTSAMLLADASQDAAFARLDQLDALDTSKLQFVKVATGDWVRYDSDPPQNRYRYGFLLDERVGQFTVRYLDLTCETLKATPVGTSEHERIGYTPQDMGELARTFAQRLGKGDEEPGERFYLSPNAPMELQGEALLLARACARRGLRAELEGLWKAIGSISDALDEVGDGQYHALSMDFANADLTRKQLLERHEKWMEVFPDHRLSEYLRPRLAILTRMVAEDSAKQARPANEPPAEDSPEALIFQLRDEFHPVQKWIFSGWFVATTAEKKESRPALRLERLRFKAVPALLKTIGEETLTRCVWYSSRYGGSFEILDIGTFAEEILQAIAGLRFYGELEERKAAWESWWKLVSEKGEVGALAELASFGDHSSPAAAEQLLKHSPQRVEAVLAGVRQATNRGVRQELVKVVAASKEESVTNFLLDELRTGPYVSARVDAAQALLERGRREGIAVFLKEWESASNPKERPEPGVPEAVADFDFAIAQSRAREAMAEFLLGTGELEAVSLVGRELLKQDPAVRDAVLNSLRGASLMELTERAAAAKKGELEDAIENILGQLLDDLRVYNGHFGFSYGDDSVSLIDPRVADLAACTMVGFWPDRYRFDPIGPARLKDRRITVLKNAWRARHGVPPLPLSTAVHVKSKDPAVPAALERAIGSANEEERRREIARLESAGLGALPWVEEKLRKLPAGHAASADLSALSRRLSNTIAEVSLEAGGNKAPVPLQSQVAELKGKPLTSAAVIGLLLSALEALPGESGDVLLIADRLGDGTGVYLQLRMVPATDEQGNSAKANTSVVADGRVLAGSYGSGARAAYDKADRYEDVAKGIDKALTLPTDKSFEIRLDVHFR
jgi:hypothetical protein